MRVRSTRGSATRRRTGGAVIIVTALLSLTLVTATTEVSSAAPVSASIPATCRGLDAATNDTLALAKGLIGSDTVAVKINATAADIPAQAGLDQTINAGFAVSVGLDQTLVDKSAGLIPAITIKDISAELLVKGPSDKDSFPTTVPGPIVIAPAAGVPTNLDVGVIGGDIVTTGGGIVTYRVGPVSLKISLSVPSAGDFNLNLGCEVDGSNLIAKTTVKDPDAPTFTPEVVELDATSGGTASVDLLNGVIAPGKTPLLPETLEIVEQPAAGTATIVNGVFTFTAPPEGGTYSTTVQICGAAKAEAGTPGVSEVQTLTLGENWNTGEGLLGIGAYRPRPVAFSLKVGEEETALINTYTPNLLALLQPFSATPTPDNWAPANDAGIVNEYALKTDYAAPTAGQVQAALEALPSIGAGNVAVTNINGNEANPAAVTGFQITYQGAKAEQDVPSVTLGQWYTVPPQEVLDRIGEAIASLAGSLGGDDGTPPSPYEAYLDTLDPNNGFDQVAADNRLVELLLTGQTQDGDFTAWIMFKLNIGALVPQITSFLNSLFPQKLAAATATQGEAPEPPQPLCAQGIIDVTVTQVEGATVTNAAVQGTSAARGIGFAG